MQIVVRNVRLRPKADMDFVSSGAFGVAKTIGPLHPVGHSFQPPPIGQCSAFSSSNTSSCHLISFSKRQRGRGIGKQQR
jgi:hypothetical protein